jgi:hypothetical protein
MRYVSITTLIFVSLLYAAPALAHERDLRTMTDGNGETEVAFCSRPSPNSFGFPGHAFVTFSTRSPDGMRVFRAIGHTVGTGTSGASAAFTYFSGGSVAGAQAEERYTSMKQACLTAKVDRVVYNQALAAAQPTLTRLGFPASVAASMERYTLGSNDCVTFAERVAATLKAAGLTVPTRSPTDTPATWINKLIASNP